MRLTQRVLSRVPSGLLRTASLLALLLTAQAAHAQDVRYGINPASRYPIQLNGGLQEVYLPGPSLQYDGAWQCQHGIIEGFAVERFPLVSVESVGFLPGDSHEVLYAKYFQHHPQADAVFLVNTICPQPPNCGVPDVSMSYTPTTDGDFYAYGGCNDDAVPFSINVRNTMGGLIGVKFSGDPTTFSLSVCASDLFMETATGHAWVEISDGQQRYCYGKYPKYTTPFSFHAEIRDDCWRNWTERVSWPLTRSRYNAALQRLHEWKRLAALGDDWYWVGEQNCMDFAAKIAEAAGVEVPRYRMIRIPRVQPLESPTPNTFCASVRLWIVLNNGCYGQRPRGKCESVFAQFSGGSGDTIAFSGHPGWLLARAADSPNAVASDFYSQATEHTAPNLVVGAHKTLSLTLAEAYPGHTLTVVDFGDGSDMEFASTEEAKERIFSAPGTYAARVIALDAAGVHVIRFNIDVLAKGKPSAALIEVPKLPPLLNQPENPGEEAVIAPFARTFPADPTCDWVANGEDLAMVLAAWGSTEPTIADIDDDGVVSGNDLAVVLAGWGSTGK